MLEVLGSPQKQIWTVAPCYLFHGRQNTWLLCSLELAPTAFLLFLSFSAQVFADVLLLLFEVAFVSLLVVVFVFREAGFGSSSPIKNEPLP